MRCPRIGLVHSSIRRGTESSRNCTRWALYHAASRLPRGHHPLRLDHEIRMVDTQRSGALSRERETDSRRGCPGWMELVVAPVEEPAADALAAADRELAAVECNLEPVLGGLAEGIDADVGSALDVGERDDRV